MALATLGVSVRFGGLTAIEDVAITLEKGEILGLIGPNGAGKTTLVNVLSGFQRPSIGSVQLEDRDLSGEPADAFARAGIARTFQAARLFRNLSVAENIETGLVAKGVSRSAARTSAKALLQEFALQARADHPATALSYGEERRVGLARALALSPSYLLLDEPAAGLSPREAESLSQEISQIRRRRGCGVLVIEHNMPLVLSLCDRIHVLGSGRTIAVGSPVEIRANATVRQAYLGSAAA